MFLSWVREGERGQVELLLLLLLPLLPLPGVRQERSWACELGPTGSDPVAVLVMPASAVALPISPSSPPSPTPRCPGADTTVAPTVTLTPPPHPPLLQATSNRSPWVTALTTCR